MSRRLLPYHGPRGTFTPSASEKRAAAMAAFSARRKAKIAAVRTALARPSGLPALRGFRSVGQRGATERKVKDITPTQYTANTTGSFTLLNGIQLGSDYNNRIGRKVVFKSVYIRGYGANQPQIAPAVALTGSQLYRMIVFVDMQPNGATPALTDILQSATSLSQLNLNNRDRFRVLRDRTFAVGPWLLSTTATQSYAATANAVFKFEEFIRLNVETIYNAGNAGTIGDINSGALYMLWVGSAASGATDGTITSSIRLRFIDP